MAPVGVGLSKRFIWLSPFNGGDTVYCCDDDGRVQVNGITLIEDEYLYNDAPLDVEPGSCHARRSPSGSPRS
jgi:hypothetical protein